MSNALIAALIEKKAFAKDTIITANYRSLDLFGRVFSKLGEFRVRRILNIDDQHIFELITLQGQAGIVKANADEIRFVDGMEVLRFADIYDLLPDGSSKKVGRKRGRKPKSQLTA